VRDLGYGRRMTGRQNVDGSIAFVVENYLIDGGTDYGNAGLNLEAAVLQDRRWVVSTNAIEFSPGPVGGPRFAKYFSFSAATGVRELATDLDGRGAKAMPGVCIVCHGGRGDPLTPPAAGGQPLFPLVQNSASLQRGDTQSFLLPLEVSALAFSAAAGYTRADQEVALKQMNKFVLCSFPLPGPAAFPEDACRRAAIPSEYQGTAATHLKAAYGGDGMPAATYADSYVPVGWSGPGQSALYLNVVAPSCRSCHFVRGTGFQSDIDFDSYAKFLSFADRSKAHVIDRGNMPLAKILFDGFWSGQGPEVLAVFLQGQGCTVRDASNAVLRPGRPIAIPGPDRIVPQGPTLLSAAGSLYASAYSWSIVSGPNGTVPPANASITGAASVQPTFSASAPGVYVVQLVARSGTVESAPAQLNLVVNNLVTPLPSAIRFSDIKAAVQSIGCAGCHTPGGPPPFFFAAVDRNGDGLINATDDDWFYAEVRGRVNFTDLVASPLLRKPSGNHHGGGSRPGFDTTLPPGQAARANYDLFLNWILNGAQR
jgi:mono/diheme cytochrome c family protein